MPIGFVLRDSTTWRSPELQSRSSLQNAKPSNRRNYCTRLAHAARVYYLTLSSLHDQPLRGRVLATLLHPGSYFGIFLLMVLTGCGLPVPEEVFIIGAGVLSANGELRPEFAFPAALLGALVGDAAMYGIGYRWGHGLLHRHPKLSKLVGAHREETFERAIERHGLKVLLLARFMVGVRGPVYLAAGVVRMPFLRFLLWDLVCATLVVGAFFGLAYFFGEEIADLLTDAEVGLTVIVVIVATVVAFVALRRHRRRLLEQVIVSAGETPTAEEVANEPTENIPQREAS